MVVPWAGIVWTCACSDHLGEKTHPLTHCIIPDKDTLVIIVGNSSCARRFRGCITNLCRRWADALLRSVVGMQ
jgi:hypothetical protein